MRECTILLPTVDLSFVPVRELSIEHSEMIEDIISKFGNCRATTCIQFTFNKETKEFQDVDCIEYKFFIPTDAQVGIEQYLNDAAQKYGKKCGVSQVYTVNHIGSAQFIDIA